MIKPPLVTFCSILGLFTVAPAIAGTVKSSAPHSVQGAAEREVVRRQEALTRSREAIEIGNKAMKQRDYDVAVQQYRFAVDVIPVSESTQAVRAKAITLFSQASVKLAEQRISEGRYADAEAIGKTVLEDQYSPGNRNVLRLLSNLERPDYYNKTITPKHHSNVEKVKQLLTEAKGFYDTARYDLAVKRYDQVLNIDPYNKTARLGLEEVNRARGEYADSAYNHARSELLLKVKQAWEIQPRKYGAGPSVGWSTDAQEQTLTAAINSKLNRIIIPRVEFRDATVREAVEFLKQKSRELDTETDPTRKGVNIVLQLESVGAVAIPSAPAGDITGLEPALPEASFQATSPADTRITLSLANIPLAEALRYITQLANLKVKIDPYAVAIVPATTMIDTLLTKEYKVSPGFLTNAPMVNQSSAPTTRAGSSGSSISGRPTAKEYLEMNGVSFPPGASAQFIAANSRLIVRNSQDQLDLIDTIVDVNSTAIPSQVEVEAKFVEVSQNDLKELSFDWLLGQWNVGGKTAMGGGTPGTGNVVDGVNFPFVDDKGRIIGGYPVTAGNRTGSGLGGAISANAIDALLYPSAGLSNAAPGIFGIAGLYTNPEFQVVIRALDQKKGVDLLSAPRVTTKSGSTAKIEIIREFRYASEFSPPQIPQTVGNTSGNGGGSASVPVTPTTPTAFETRNTGVTLEVQPVVGPDGTTIDLSLAPEVVEFEGFINYGSPILAPAHVAWYERIIDTVTKAVEVYAVNVPESVITPNVINQPIFSTRRVSTNVSVWDGQTVALGGLMREDVQKVEDKVPFLGDIPIVGRAFRSSVDQHIKRNLVIFVTARLINPAGDPLHGFDGEEDEDETLDAMIPEQLQLPGEAMPLFTK